MTPLPKNEFISNSARQAAESAVASKPPPAADATAAPISESALVPAMAADAAAAPDLTDPPVAVAVLIDEPSMTMEATCKESLQVQDGATDCIGEIFHHVRKLLAEDNRRAEDFVDWQALLYTIEEGTELPLFIRAGDHLRRWA